MRSPPEALLVAVLVAGVCGAAHSAVDTSGSLAVNPVRSAPASSGVPITPEEMRAAAAKLRQDPNLGGTHSIRSLRWTGTRAAAPREPPPPWIEGLFDYLGQTGSVLLWVVGAIAAAVAVIWAYRTFKARIPAPQLLAEPVVSRIGELDITPESLPADIGAEALALAEAGKTRAALSLLYRGALSRAVHRFGVPIGQSYTEGEALRAVAARLDPARVSYFSDLVGIWRRTVYAGEALSGDPVRHLCRRFADLDTAVP